MNNRNSIVRWNVCQPQRSEQLLKSVSMSSPFYRSEQLLKSVSMSSPFYQLLSVTTKPVASVACDNYFCLKKIALEEVFCDYTKYMCFVWSYTSATTNCNSISRTQPSSSQTLKFTKLVFNNTDTHMQKFRAITT